MPADATGNVTFTIGNIYKTFGVTGGNNSFVVTGVPVGEHNVTVTYSGDGKYTKISKSATVTLTEPVTMRFGAVISFTA